MFHLFLIKNDGLKTYDITPIADSIGWDYNLSMLSAMEFPVLFHDMPRFFPKNPIDVGDGVVLMEDGNEVYRGIVVSENRSGRDAIKYSVYDYAWYLGKSKSVYQFNRVPASEAITKVLTDFGLLIGQIPHMATVVDEIYIEKSPAEIINDIWKKHERQSGKRFVAEMRQGKIYFEEMKDRVIQGTFRLANEEYNVMDAPLGASRNRSIEEMRNRIKILLEREGEQYDVVATAQDEENIRKYGLLEDVFKIEAQDEAKAREVARILLSRLNRIHETNELTLMGDTRIRAGHLIDIDEPTTGMKGRFMITQAKHEVKNQIHTTTISLALPEDVR